MSRKAKIDFFLGLGVFIASLAVYLRTMTPKLGWIDCGELSVVCATLGIAHPTGYPLYTLLGRLFTLIPVGQVCQRVSLLSAFFASLGALTTFLIVARGRQPQQAGAGEPHSLNRLAGGVVAGLLLAFSSTYWSQAVDQEVYSLSAFLLALLIYSVSLWARRPSLRGLAALAYLGGLALGNHLTILWSGIAAILFVLWTCRKAVFNKALWMYLALGTLGVSLYAVLVVRAWQDPLLSWGDVRSFKHLFGHLSAKQYRVWMFSEDFGVLVLNFKKFLALWVGQVTPLVFGLGILGVLALVRKNRPWLGFLGLVFGIDLLFALNYSIPDIASYFIPAFLVWVLLCGEGVIWLLDLLGKRSRVPALTQAVRWTLPLVFLFPLLGHWRENDLSRNFIPYDFGQNVLRSAEPNALVLTNNWDIYSPILYLQYIKRARTDVAMVDKELLRRSWYFKYLREQHPWLIRDSEPEVAAYLAMLDEFEAGTLKDNAEIQRRYLAMITSFIQKALSASPPRPVYLTMNPANDPMDFPGIAPGLRKVPCGLLYRVQPEDSVVPCRPDYELRGVFDQGIYKDERTLVNLSNYPRMGYERAMVLASHQRFSEAASELRGLLDLTLNRRKILVALGGCELEAGNLEAAEEAFQEALREDPLDLGARQGLEEIVRRRQGGK